MKKRDKTFLKILRLLRPYSVYLAFTVVMALVYVGASLAAPFLAGLAIDCMLGEGNVDFPLVFRIFGGMGCCIVAAPVAQWVMSLCNNKVAYHVLADVRLSAFKKIERLPLRYIDDRAYGDVANVIITDAEQFSDGLLLGFTQLFTGVATIVGVLAVMLVMRWEIALVVFCITPLSLFASKFIASRTYSLFRKQSEVRAEETAFLDEMIGNLKVVKAYTRADENERDFREVNERLRKCSLKAVFYSSTTNPVTRFINSVVYAAVAFAGALFVIGTAGAAVPFTAGNLTTFLSYSNQYTKPFNEISEVVAEFQNALACASRLFALIEEEEERSDEGNERLGRAAGEVSLRGVEFSYRPDRPLIEGLDLEVKEGMRVAIVGPTGCGKTTLINLLMRFYDINGGSISLDGRDIRSITRRSLRSNYGMVLQETWLKRATVRENLIMGNPDCSEEEMIAAAKAAHAHSFIMRLPEGYDTVIGGDGSLSQGQRQLLCIARIMLCRPPVLILDEATSSIDTRTERKVQEAFNTLMEGRTCFIVAHRLSTIRNADVILVMNAGRVVEQGTHAQLLEKGGFYAELYNAQFAF